MPADEMKPLQTCFEDCSGDAKPLKDCSRKEVAEPLEDFSNEEDLHKIWRFMNPLGVVVALFSVVYMFCYRLNPQWLKSWLGDTWEKGIAAFLLVLWFIGPPVWFVYEVQCLLKRDDKQQKPKRLAEFRYGQDGSKAVWVAVAALMALFFKRD